MPDTGKCVHITPAAVKFQGAIRRRILNEKLVSSAQERGAAGIRTAERPRPACLGAWARARARWILSVLRI